MVLFSRLSTAQDDLGKQLSKVAGQNAANYLSPVLSAWGADLNSGLYHSADLHDILGFDFGLKVGAVIVKDEDKVFDLVLPDQIAFTYNGVQYPLIAGRDYDKVISGAPTALGESNGKAVTVNFHLPPGIQHEVCSASDASGGHRLTFRFGGHWQVRSELNAPWQRSQSEFHRVRNPPQY
jgi:hypothetical protein